MGNQQYHTKLLLSRVIIPLHEKKITAIITHEHPDLDAILSTYLLIRFGSEKFPGIENAEIQFFSAGNLPKKPDELEKEGVLAVDIGGGRFDTHPVDDSVDDRKLERAATDLVGQSLGMLETKGWGDLIEYTRQHDTTGRNVQSRDFIHHLPTLMTILYGSEILFEDNPNKSQRMMELGISLLDALGASYDDDDLDERQQIEQLKDHTDRYMRKKGIDPDDLTSAYHNFILWRKRLEEEPENAFSPDLLDKSMSLLAISAGYSRLYEDDPDRLADRMDIAFDAILARELKWYDALRDLDQNGSLTVVKKPSKKKSRNVKIVAVESGNGMVIRAARFRHHADMVIYRDSTSGGTSILLNRNGPLKYFKLEELTGKVRWAEASKRREKLDLANLKSLGKWHGWFLHQSRNLLICGSKKATDFEPSRIGMNELVELASTSINWKDDKKG